MLRNKKYQGFTLIELLVVIAIIGILASIVLVSLSGARSKARDARRESDIRQISLAMEMQYDSSTSYPAIVTDGGAYGRITNGAGITSYLDPFPKDPGGGTNACNDVNDDYCAWQSAVGSTYCIFTPLENGGKWFVASKKGTRIENASPSNLATCN